MTDRTLGYCSTRALCGRKIGARRARIGDACLT